LYNGYYKKKHFGIFYVWKWIWCFVISVQILVVVSC
jgi:hypothetical protein